MYLCHLPAFLLNKNKLIPETSAKALVVLEKNCAHRHVFTGDSARSVKTLSVTRLMETSFVGSGCAQAGQAKCFIASSVACCVASDFGGSGIGNKIARAARRTHITEKTLKVIFMMDALSV
jgi:hypothetical protein